MLFRQRIGPVPKLRKRGGLYVVLLQLMEERHRRARMWTGKKLQDGGESINREETTNSKQNTERFIDYLFKSWIYSLI